MRDTRYQSCWLWKLCYFTQVHKVVVNSFANPIFTIHTFSQENIDKTENVVGVSVNDCRIFFDGSRVQERR